MSKIVVIIMGLVMSGSISWGSDLHCGFVQNPLCLFKLLEKTETFHSVRIQNLSEGQGRFLTVLYVHAHRNLSDSDSQDLTVDHVYHVVPSVLVTGDPVILPSFDMPPKIENQINYVVFAFHNEVQFFWTNPDGSHPDDPRLEHGGFYLRTVPTTVKVVSKKNLSALATAQNHPSEVVVSM